MICFLWIDSIDSNGHFLVPFWWHTSDKVRPWQVFILSCSRCLIRFRYIYHVLLISLWYFRYLVLEVYCCISTFCTSRIRLSACHVLTKVHTLWHFGSSLFLLMAGEMVIFAAWHDGYYCGQYAVIFHCDHLIHLRTLLAQVFLWNCRSLFRVVVD